MPSTKKKPKKKPRPSSSPKPQPIAPIICAHFRPLPFESLAVSERTFPFHMRADVQAALESVFVDPIRVVHFGGVRQSYAHEGISFGAFMGNPHDPVIASPPEYEELDIGEASPMRCLKCGLWQLEQDGMRFAVLLSPASRFGRNEGIRVQVATPPDDAGRALSESFLRNLQQIVQQSRTYRGKILSLEDEDRHTGESTGIRVHKLRAVPREQVILPRKTLDLIDRNIVRFIEQRPALARRKQSTKKGVLFYGPPGTGKTHTLHYLAGALPGHTTLLITAEQVGLLDTYIMLARLLQPSVVVIEDVDLVARDRQHRSGPCDEALLNKLLNEMDGLREEADVLFVLTTNRPEDLEAALAARPGRVDQAIEFPLPDEECRKKLIALYSRGAIVAGEILDLIVKRTQNVSAAFIKELMRRAMQFSLERGADGTIDPPDIDAAMNEMLFEGGSLNAKLLGAQAANRA